MLSSESMALALLRRGFEKNSFEYVSMSSV
jgi:hypothetical protein